MTNRLDEIKNRSTEIAAMLPNSVFADETNELVGYILILSGEVERLNTELEATKQAFEFVLAHIKESNLDSGIIFPFYIPNEITAENALKEIKELKMILNAEE